jgi:hypothetical protein
MRNIQFVLLTAIAVLGWAVNAQAVPTINLGNYDLLPNTPGQKIPLYVTGIVPSNGAQTGGAVDAMDLSVSINEGGVDFGGLPGPAITSFDLDTGPTIWVPPNANGYDVENEYLGGQLANIAFITFSNFVHVAEGPLATLIIDTTGFNGGTYPLRLSGGIISVELGDTQFYGVGLPGSGGAIVTSINYDFYGGTAGQITIVPEPSSLALAAIGLMGLAAWG